MLFRSLLTGGSTASARSLKRILRVLSKVLKMSITFWLPVNTSFSWSKAAMKIPIPIPFSAVPIPPTAFETELPVLPKSFTPVFTSLSCPSSSPTRLLSWSMASISLEASPSIFMFSITAIIYALRTPSKFGAFGTCLWRCQCFGFCPSIHRFEATQLSNSNNLSSYIVE